MKHSFIKLILIGGFATLLAAGLFVLLAPAGSAVTGVPKIISYQGRLANPSGTLLSGTFYFRFSIWDSSDTATGTRLWPSAPPGTATASVAEGVFNVNVGDTANGYPDALTFDFYQNQDVFLQVEVSSTGASSSFEILAPRQRIGASGFAINAETVSGKLRASSTADYTFDVINEGAGRANLQTEGIVRVGNYSSAPTTLGGGSLYYDTANNNLFVWNTASSTWTSLGGGGGGGSTLQQAYDLGNTITATSARDILITLSDTVTDPNFVVTIATSSTGFVEFKTPTTTIAKFEGSLITLGKNVNLGTNTLQANTLTPNAAATVGTTTQNLTLQGNLTTITSAGANNIAMTPGTSGEVNITAGNLDIAAGALQLNNTVRISNVGAATLASVTASSSTIQGNETITGNLSASGTLTIASSSSLQGFTFTTGTGTSLTLTGGGTVLTIQASTGTASLQGVTFSNATGSGNLQAATLTVTGQSTLATTTIQGNTLQGTTAAIDFMNFDVTSAGAVTATSGTFTAAGTALTVNNNASIAGVTYTGTAITPASAFTIGSLNQTLTLQGTSTTIIASGTNAIAFTTGGSTRLQVLDTGTIQPAQDVDIIPATTAGISTLGSASIPWDEIYGGTITATSITASSTTIQGNQTVTGTLSADIVNATTSLRTGGTERISSTGTATFAGNLTVSGTASLATTTISGTNQFSAANVSITGGSIDGTTIGATTQATAKFSNATTTGTLQVQGTLFANTIQPTGAMTIGVVGQNVTLQGATATITSDGANNIVLTPGTSGEVNITAGNLDIAAGALQLNNTTRISNAGVATLATTTVTGDLDVSGLIEAGSSNIRITTSTGFIDADAIALSTTGTTTTTSSPSGLEAVSDRLSLLRGCAASEILKWSLTNQRWECSPDTGGAGADSDWLFNGSTMYATTSINSVAIGTTTGEALLHVRGQATGTPVFIAQATSSQVADILQARSNTGSVLASISSAGTVSIAAGQSYTGAGAVTVSSGGTGLLSLLSASSTLSLDATGVASASGTIKIADSDLFILGSRSTEPTAPLINGTMYYDTGLTKFRCFENGLWTNCIGAGAGGGGGSLQASYNTSTHPEIVLNNSPSTTAGITLRDNSSPIPDDLFEIQTNAGTDIFAVATSSLRYRPTGDIASTFTVQNAAANLTIFTVDAASSQVKVGSASTTTALLVIDTRFGTTTDPTGTNGAIYYNASSSKFRCFENATWTNCIGAGGVTGNFVSLEPSSADAGTSTNPSIWINDTGGGALLRLQTGGVDRFLATSTGAVTITATGTEAALLVNQTSIGNLVTFQDAGTTTFQIADGGAATFQNVTNSASAFRVLNSGGSALLTVDTSVNTVSLATTTVTGNFNIASPGILQLGGTTRITQAGDLFANNVNASGTLAVVGVSTLATTTIQGTTLQGTTAAITFTNFGVTSAGAVTATSGTFTAAGTALTVNNNASIGGVTYTGTAITPASGFTIGSLTQTLTLQGTSTTIIASGTNAISFTTGGSTRLQVLNTGTIQPAQDVDIIPATSTGVSDLGSASIPWDNLFVSTSTITGTLSADIVNATTSLRTGGVQRISGAGVADLATTTVTGQLSADIVNATTSLRTGGIQRISGAGVADLATTTVTGNFNIASPGVLQLGGTTRINQSGDVTANNLTFAIATGTSLTLTGGGTVFAIQASTGTASLQGFTFANATGTGNFQAGSINNTPIGGTTAQTAVFTNATTTGTFTAQGLVRLATTTFTGNVDLQTNTLQGTTAAISFTNFGVTSAGALTATSGTFTAAGTALTVNNNASIAGVTYTSSAITPAAGFTVGSLTQTLTLQGTSTTIIASGTNAISFTTGGSTRLQVLNTGTIQPAQDVDIIPATSTGVSDLGSATIPWDNLFVSTTTVSGTLLADIVNATTSLRTGGTERISGSGVASLATTTVTGNLNIASPGVLQLGGTTRLNQSGDLFGNNVNASGTLIVTGQSTLATTTIQGTTLQGTTAAIDFTNFDVTSAGNLFANNLNATGTLTVVGVSSLATTTVTGNLNIASPGVLQLGGTTRITQAGVATFATTTISGGNLDIGANTLQGTTAIIDFTNFDVSSTGTVTMAGNLNVSGVSALQGLTFTNATGSGVLTLTGGGNVFNISASTGTASIAGVTYSSSAITPASAFTVGAQGQNLTIQGAQLDLIATSTNPMRFFAGGTERMRLTDTGKLLIGTTATTSGIVNIVTSTSAALGVGGIYEEITLNTAATGTFQFGNRQITYVSPTASTTAIGTFIRTIDNTSLANTVRALEVQAFSGTNAQGVNTGIISFGRTFGVQGISDGTAGGVLIPAGLFGEIQATSSGNALRAYTKNLEGSTTSLALFFQEISTFQGTGLQMNFGRGGGTFTGNFLDLQRNDVSRFAINATGTTAIGTSSAIFSSASGGMLVVCAQGNCTLPTTSTSSVVWLASVDGTASSNSLVAKGQVQSGLADYGEWVAVQGKASEYEQGDLLAASGIGNTFQKSATSYDPFLTGVVTNAAAFVAGGEVDVEKERVIMSLAGRVLAKVIGENGPIAIGDLITASSKSGYGMRATQSGRVIGMALESFSVASSTDEGKIMIFVNPHWYYPSPTEVLQGGESGTGVMNNYTFDENASISVYEIKVQKLTVGSAESPAGITLFDRITKLPYCLYIEQGAIRAIPGGCDERVNQPAVQPAPSPTPTPIDSISLTEPSPSPSPEPTPSESPSPSPTPSESPLPSESPIPQPSPSPSPEPTPSPSPEPSPSPSPSPEPSPSQ